MGCYTLGDEHHLFVQCPRYKGWRESEGRVIANRSEIIAAKFDTHDDVKKNIKNVARQLFADLHVWPMNRSKFYLGLIPNTSNLIPPNHPIETGTRRKLLHAIAAEWHNASVRLAGRIYSDYSRETARMETNQ